MLYKITFLLFGILFNYGIVVAQYNPNSIGICSVQPDTTEYYIITIVVPCETLEKPVCNNVTTLTYRGQYYFLMSLESL